MALRVSDDDQNLNPGQVDSDRKFDVLKKAETNGSNDNQTDNSYDSDALKNAEENPTDEWKNNVTGKALKTPKSGRVKNFLKKKGPSSLIITVLLGGGIGLTTFFSPGILLVHIKEVMVNKFNTQLASMDVRTTKMLVAKMGTTKGSCKVITIACKYSTMTDKQIANFEKAGIVVETDGKTILGRSKPKNFIFNDEKISAKDFSKRISDNAEFRSAIKTAYNPKYAGFADSIWRKAASKLGITKAKVSIDGDTDEAKLKDMQKKTDHNKNLASDDVGKELKKGDKKSDGITEYTPEEIESHNKALKSSQDLLDNVGDIEKSGVKSASPSVFSGTVKKVSGVVSITGFVDNACMAYNSIRALGYAAKTIRAIQLASYAMIFLNVADQIKAGDAKAEDVSYLGTVLTSTVAKVDGKNTNVKSATDSFGYKYAAYGDLGKMPTSSTQFMAGGGLAGELTAVTTIINKALGNTPKKTCGFLGNPIVAGASIVGGILLAVFAAPVGIGKIALQAAQTAAIIAATVAIPAMLQDIVAGVIVDESTVGEDAGDAIVSGSSGIMGAAAAAGGNAPLTPEQAVAYNNLSNNIAAQYAEEDRIAYNPFDITNSNTFFGQIAFNLMPYFANMSSISNTFQSIAGLASGTLLKSINNTVKADDSETEYTMCEDPDYVDLNSDGNRKDRVATDPFCNVIYGIPPKYLEKDPLDVIDDLKGQIDEQTGAAVAGSAYSTFLENCINRDRPLGDTGDGSQDDGSMCLINKENSDYYLYAIDQRVQKGMDGEDTALAEAESASLNDISFYESSETEFNNIAEIEIESESTINDSVRLINSISTCSNVTHRFTKKHETICDNNHLSFVRSRELRI